jgi:molybdopterin/thiamine biosynthesis adenylyltransferase
MSNNEEDRFRRIDHIEHKRLETSRIVLCGAGSIGSTIMQAMCLHGVGRKRPGKWTIIEHDIVEPANILCSAYKMHHVGMTKTDAMAQIVAEDIDTEIQVDTWHHKITATDIPQIRKLCDNCDLLLLTFDDFEVVMRLSDECYGACQQLIAPVNEFANSAIVAFSIPGQTSPLSKTLSSNPETKRIDQAQALGTTTNRIANYAAEVGLRLLLPSNAKGFEYFPRIFCNAPLHVLGFRRVWLFKNMPEDFSEGIYMVESE